MSSRELPWGCKDLSREVACFPQCATDCMSILSPPGRHIQRGERVPQLTPSVLQCVQCVQLSNISTGSARISIPSCFSPTSSPAETTNCTSDPLEYSADWYPPPVGPGAGEEHREGLGNTLAIFVVRSVHLPLSHRRRTARACEERAFSTHCGGARRFIAPAQKHGCSVQRSCAAISVGLW